MHTMQPHLEVVAERPVSQHLKERVMIDVFTNIIQIVVFTTRANALLAVNCSHKFAHVALRVNRSLED